MQIIDKCRLVGLVGNCSYNGFLLESHGSFSQIGLL